MRSERRGGAPAAGGARPRRTRKSTSCDPPSEPRPERRRASRAWRRDAHGRAPRSVVAASRRRERDGRHIAFNDAHGEEARGASTCPRASSRRRTGRASIARPRAVVCVVPQVVKAPPIAAPEGCIDASPSGSILPSTPSPSRVSRHAGASVEPPPAGRSSAASTAAPPPRPVRVHHRAVVRRAPHGVHHPSQHVRGGYGTERSRVRGSCPTPAQRPSRSGAPPAVSRTTTTSARVGRLCSPGRVPGGRRRGGRGRAGAGTRRRGRGVRTRRRLPRTRGGGRTSRRVPRVRTREARTRRSGARGRGACCARRGRRRRRRRAWRAGDGGVGGSPRGEHLRTQAKGRVLDDASDISETETSGRALPERELDAEGHGLLRGLLDDVPKAPRSVWVSRERAKRSASAAPRRALGRARRGVPSPGKPRRRGFRYQLYARDRRQRRAPETSFGRVLRSSARAHLGASPKVTVPWRRS